MDFVFPEKVQLAHLPTPIQKLSRLSQQLEGPDIYIKRDDLTGIAVSGNKVRKLEFTTAYALQEGCDVLITCGGTQSNHCRATAAVAARLGLHCHLVLRGEVPEVLNGNLFLDHLLGAEITYLPRAKHEDLDAGMEQLAKEYARQGKKALVIPLGASDALGSLGYIAAIQEMMRQFREIALVPEYIVSAAGSGGTLAGLLLGKKLFNLSSQMIGINVCDDEAYFHQEIARILQEFHKHYAVEIKIEPDDYRIIDGYVGKGYALSQPEEKRVIMQIAKTEGLIMDTTYTGKAMYGLSQEIKKGTFKRGEKVLFIHTGGIYGLFPHVAEFSKEVF